MCYLDGIASFLWEEEVVGTEKSSLNVNVSSLSLWAEEEQEIQVSLECSLPVKGEAQEESVELNFSQYNTGTNLFNRLTCGDAASFSSPPTSCDISTREMGKAFFIHFF